MAIKSILRSNLGKIGALSLFILLVRCVVSDEDAVDSGNLSEATNLELPVLADDSYMLGNQLGGDMRRHDLVSGANELFSSPSDWGSRSDYTGSVDISNNMIITVNEASALVALDAHSGDYLFSGPLGHYLFDSSLNSPTSPVCAGDVCYAMGAGGDVVAIDVVDRRLLWQNDIFPSIEQALRQYPLLVTENKIFAGAYRVNAQYGEIEPKLNVYPAQREMY